MDNIDARLTKITNGLNTLLAMQAKNEEKFLKTEATFRKADKKFQQVTRNFETVLDSLKRLERIALAHEARLSRQERRKK